ncbi:MAG: hypothetical protein AB8B69_09130 [Chitinophagales bacterium]
MKPSIFIILLFLLACGSPEGVKEEKKVEKEEVYEKVEFVEDTILERNNPKALDLTKHQLFIDTTRNSIFYERLIQWKANQRKNETVETYLAELNKISKSKKSDFGDFPRLFVRVNKLEDEFVLYDRCDGTDPRYELRDSAFIFYGPLESDAETIKDVYQKNGKSIKLQLNSFKAKTPDEVSALQIDRTKHPGIYSLKYKNQNYSLEEYVIPIEDVEKFDLVVNHCPVMKVLEYAPFY